MYIYFEYPVGNEMRPYLWKTTIQDYAFGEFMARTLASGQYLGYDIKPEFGDLNEPPLV